MPFGARTTAPSPETDRPDRRGTGALGASLLVAALAGCGALGGGPDKAPAAQFEPAGWLDPDDVLGAADFADYARRVGALVDAHRLSFDPGDAERENRLVAPREYVPGPDCGAPRAVALLVHGLAESAYSTGDLAEALARHCVLARTMLLPGHGTRAGDLLVVDDAHWRDAVRHLARQASAEHEVVLLGGVSLGATLALDVALESDGDVDSGDASGIDVDALLAVSPAYALSRWRLVRFAPLLRPFMPWVDEDRRDDWARYEATPMQGLAATVGAIRHLRARLDEAGDVDVPWMLVQSRDDGVVDPAANRALFAERARAPGSLLVEIGRGPRPADLDAGSEADAVWLRGDDPALRTDGVGHAAVHVSPENPHWGIDGDYRSCGENIDRDRTAVAACLEDPDVLYSLDARSLPASTPSARPTFNPAFDELEALIGRFVDALLESG